MLAMKRKMTNGIQLGEQDILISYFSSRKNNFQILLNVDLEFCEVNVVMKPFSCLSNFKC